MDLVEKMNEKEGMKALKGDCDDVPPISISNFPKTHYEDT